MAKRGSQAVLDGWGGCVGCARATVVGAVVVPAVWGVGSVRAAVTSGVVAIVGVAEPDSWTDRVA